MLKRICILNLLFALTLIAIVDVFAETTVQAFESDVDVLRRLKTVDWPRAYREQDETLLDRILADEFEKVAADGKRTSKKDELEFIRKNRPTYSSFKFDITRLEVFENGTAMVSGIGDIRGTDAKGAYRTSYSSSNVLIKRAGVWKAIASHVSGVVTTYE